MERLFVPDLAALNDPAADRQISIENFRHERMEEPLEAYLEAFEERQDAFENLLETTLDLRDLGSHAIDILLDPQLLDALRYIAAPPISLDDLKVVADTKSLSAKSLKAKPEDAQRLIETVLLGLDRRRFPWIAENREPTETEKHAAILASAALLASQRVATDRRSEGKTAQEMLVENTLLAAKFAKLETRAVNTLADGPEPGHFCRESMLGTRKADVLVGLWDRRLMPIECKVSNSETNSIKRLNNDAAAKAEIWRKDFGEVGVVPTAVLSGCYKMKHLCVVRAEIALGRTLPAGHYEACDRRQVLSELVVALGHAALHAGVDHRVANLPLRVRHSDSPLRLASTRVRRLTVERFVGNGS